MEAGEKIKTCLKGSNSFVFESTVVINNVLFEKKVFFFVVFIFQKCHFKNKFHVVRIKPKCILSVLYASVYIT